MTYLMDATVTSTDISTVLESLGSVFTFLIGKVGEVFSTIQTYPIALIPVGVYVGFVCVRFAKNILGI